MRKKDIIDCIEDDNLKYRDYGYWKFSSSHSLCM